MLVMMFARAALAIMCLMRLPLPSRSRERAENARAFAMDTC